MLIMSSSLILSAATKVEIDEIKNQMIQNSISSYSGPCPCPYNVMKNGRKCGGRSAYSRPGGSAPLCYLSDISDREAEKFLKRK